jgi:hypothetical protein
MGTSFDIPYPVSGLSAIYVVAATDTQVVRASNGALIDDTTANFPLAGITTSDAVRDCKYVGDIPAGTPAGTYSLTAYIRLGATNDPTDPIIGGALEIVWDGTGIVDGNTASDLLFDGDAAGGSTTTDVVIGEAYDVLNIARYIGAELFWTSADAVEHGSITDYADAGSGASVVTVSPAFTAAPTAGDRLQIVRSGTGGGGDIDVEITETEVDVT